MNSLHKNHKVHSLLNLLHPQRKPGTSPKKLPGSDESHHIGCEEFMDFAKKKLLINMHVYRIYQKNSMVNMKFTFVQPPEFANTEMNCVLTHQQSTEGKKKATTTLLSFTPLFFITKGEQRKWIIFFWAHVCH